MFSGIPQKETYLLSRKGLINQIIINDEITVVNDPISLVVEDEARKKKSDNLHNFKIINNLINKPPTVTNGDSASFPDNLLLSTATLVGIEVSASAICCPFACIFATILTVFVSPDNF
jgi:hypothetical protein